MPDITARLNKQGMKEFSIAWTKKGLFCFSSNGAGDFPLLILQTSTLESSLFSQKSIAYLFHYFLLKNFVLLLDLFLMLVVLVK